MSEIIGFKQKFILDAFQGEAFSQCCLFTDATKVFSTERECLRHSTKNDGCEACFGCNMLSVVLNLNLIWLSLYVVSLELMFSVLRSHSINSGVMRHES